MEPLFFKAENLTLSVSASTPDSLQWSRFFSKRKIEQTYPLSDSNRALQWSRFFSKRKMFCHLCPVCPLVSASMEPLFFKAENRCLVGRDARGACCFNGAAFFQSGKSSSRLALCARMSMLQWSRFFSKRKMENKDEKHPNGNGASMEPLFFKAENIARHGVSLKRWSGFNGAAFFQSGKCVLFSVGLATSQACFNGAAFFQSGKSGSSATGVPSASRKSFNGAAFFQSGKSE